MKHLRLVASLAFEAARIFGSSFITGRGNLISTTRWDVEYPTTSASAVTSSSKYNTAGAVVSRTSPWDGTSTRTIKIGYTDNWNSGSNPSTFAYPTSVTDPANISSTVKYRYDIGANVEANSPAPAGQDHGKTTKRVYDDKGRLERDSVFINTTEHAYTRYEFPTNGIQSQVFSTIVDTNSNGPDPADEVLSESWFDGAGRVRFSRVPHTFSSGSTASWAGSITEYDILGRVKRQSVPTEVNSNWEATGDDTDFLWTVQKYDWMGRVVRKINTDGTDSSTLNDSDVLISYAGCGCAGGLVTTIEGELVPRTDTTGNARRKQKSYADILGRTFKAETYEWDGTSVYSTVSSQFNGRDQVLRSRQYAGTDSSTTFQDTLATFDGHGRLKTSHRPEQQNPVGTPASTIYNYNADDSISEVVDARGAVSYRSYNNLGLLSHIAWNVPVGSNIEIPDDVWFVYDNLGNRTQMTDGLGSVTYQYNQLSQMTAETRVFSDTGTGLPNNTAALEYTYTLSGKLASYKLPFFSNLEVKYDFDKIGRLDAVSGTSSLGNFDYADNPHYRAWGALTHLDYGNGVEMNVTAFNNKLQATGFEVKKGTTQIIDKTYQFNNDGSVKQETDVLNAKFDRSYEYDHQTRMTKALTGAEARGQTDNPNNIPYRTTYQYNAFGQRTESVVNQYSQSHTSLLTFTNNRRTVGTQDAEGNLLYDEAYK